MLSDDGHNEPRDSPIPKPRPRINQVAPADAGSPITVDDVGEGTPKRKKKSGLSRLKDRKRADEVILDAAAGDAHTPEDREVLQDSDVEDINDSETKKAPNYDGEITDKLVEKIDSVFKNGEVTVEDSEPPLSSRKKKHKGALSRLKEKQNLNGSLSSLRSAEVPDLRLIDDCGVLSTPTPTKSTDGAVEPTGVSPKNAQNENSAEEGTVVTEPASPLKVTDKLRLPSEETSFKPIAPASGRLLDKIDMNDVVETDEDAEDNDELALNYEKLLSSPQKGGALAFPSPGRGGAPAFPSPKPSSNTIHRSSSITKPNQMSKSDSMPNISESVRSSKRNWEVIRSKIGLEAIGTSADDTMRRSASTLSVNTTASSPGIQSLRISTARHKNFLVGQKQSHSSVMGATELDRTFPDRNINIFVGTWNIYELKQLDDSIEDFILPKSLEFVPDMFVITTQENELDRREWELTLQETVGPSHVVYHSVQHGTLHIAVLMKRELIWYCSVPESDTVTVRVFKQIRTKGAVALSFTMFGTSFVFIGSHFKSDEGNGKARVSDYKTINRTLKLPRAVVDNPLQQTPPLASLRFDCVFWAGDLNFRINKDRESVIKMIKSVQLKDHPNYEPLLEHEELTRGMANGEIFEDFQEGQINFPPTYKFDPGTDVYDTTAKCRIPSYTDRILFKSKRKHGIVCKKYLSAPEVKCSDHKPVYALYQVNLKPGRDTIPLSGGQFRRDVYIEAAKRRALRRVAANLKSSSQVTSKSSICVIC